MIIGLRSAAVTALSALALAAGCSSEPSSGTSGGGDGDSGLPKVLAAPSGGVAVRVDRARQARGYEDPVDNALQLSVTVANGDGGKPLLLEPALFRIETKDGLLRPPIMTVSTLRFVDARRPPAAAELAAGASYPNLGLAFDVTPGSAVRLVYATPEAQGGLADGRRAVAPVAAAPCAACGALCTYLDRETSVCCDGPAPDGGSCANQVPVCPASRTLCGTGAARACVDTARDANNCGRCGAKVPSGGACDRGFVTCTRTGAVVCGAQCTNVATDPQNCGRCGRACAGSVACKDGACGGRVDFSNPTSVTTCNALCATVGLRCSDAGAFGCMYAASDYLGNGSCGGMSGTEYDNTGIPGGGGSKGIKWYGFTCASEITVYAGRDRLACHCVE